MNSLEYNLLSIVTDISAAAAAFFDFRSVTARCRYNEKSLIDMNKLIGPLISVHRLVLLFSDVFCILKRTSR